MKKRILAVLLSLSMVVPTQAVIPAAAENSVKEISTIENAAVEMDFSEGTSAETGSAVDFGAGKESTGEGADSNAGGQESSGGDIFSDGSDASSGDNDGSQTGNSETGSDEGDVFSDGEDSSQNGDSSEEDMIEFADEAAGENTDENEIEFAEETAGEEKDAEALTPTPTPKPKTYKITYVLNSGKNNSANPKTYTSEKEVKLKNPSRPGYHFVGWYKEKSFKNKITAIKKGSTGNLTLYAKWTPQVNASKSAASLTGVSGAKANTIKVTASVAKYVKSYDDYYYLLYVNPVTGKAKATSEKVKKPEAAKKNLSFNLSTSGHPEYVQGKFAIGVKKSKSAYTVISSAAYVKNPEKLSSIKTAYYKPSTKKGMQADSYAELVETNSKNAFKNLDASTIIGNQRVSYKYNGKTYKFDDLGGMKAFVSQCNAAGIQVTMQIHLDWKNTTKDMTVGGSPYKTTTYYGWNTSKSTSRQKMEAMFAYLSECFSRNDCFVSNWNLGNEVDTASTYYYLGNVSVSKFTSMYAEAFRCLYNAVRSKRASSKVFICLTNCWNTKNSVNVAYPAKSVLSGFASAVSKLQSGVSWNLAYHAYSQPLTETTFWKPRNASLQTNNANTTTFITMYNINALTSYVKSTYGSGRSIILSEQGYSSSGSQKAQAAALALAYYKAACNPNIDAFIIRSYKDQANEVNIGMVMGLKTSAGKKKTAFNVFKYMDSSKSLNYTESLLKSQVGSNWKSYIPNYKKSLLYKRS